MFWVHVIEELGLDASTAPTWYVDSRDPVINGAWAAKANREWEIASCNWRRDSDPGKYLSESPRPPKSFS